MEEEQKRQIGLIKQVYISGINLCLSLNAPFTLSITPNSDFLQVTEREHERMISELNAKYSEELSEMKAELRESLEAAHQAELQQLRVCYPIYPWM